MVKVTHERWKAAQEYERNWWNNYENVDVDWYRNCSREVEGYVSRYIDIGPDTKILEIGAGPIGILTFLNSDEKYAIDPLEEFFSRSSFNIKQRDPRVIYISGQAENLPYEDDYFDLVIMDNVLDHCEDPSGVFANIDRVIKTGGIIYVRQNVYNAWGRMMRRLLELFIIDRGHPHTFSESFMLSYSLDGAWKILHREGSSYFKTWLSDLISGNVKGVIKFILFITRNTQVYIWQKSE